MAQTKFPDLHLSKPQASGDQITFETYLNNLNDIEHRLNQFNDLFESVLTPITYKGIVGSKADLPTTANVGDMWYAKDEDAYYAWVSDDDGWVEHPYGTFNLASDKKNGLMAKEDKSKLDAYPEYHEIKKAFQLLESALANEDILLQKQINTLVNAKKNIRDKLDALEPVVLDHENRIQTNTNTGTSLQTNKQDKAITATGINGGNPTTVEQEFKDAEAERNTLESKVTSTKKDVVDLTTRVSTVEGKKQDTDIKTFKGSADTVEKALNENHEAIEAAKTREDNFLKRDSGEMKPGYNASGNKQVIVKETFDHQKESVAAEIADLYSKLAYKADISDIGSQLLVYYFETPLPPIKESTNVLKYTFGSDFAEWLAKQTDDGTPTGTPLISKGDQVEIVIKDASDTPYLGTESWNNGSATKGSFGSHTDASWQTTETTLEITTNAQNADVDRTLRSLLFTINPVTGNSVDTVARNDIASLETKKQNKDISITGISAVTVEGALAEIKNNNATALDRTKGISYDGPNKTTLVSDNIHVSGTLDAKKITQGGKELALKEEVELIINFNDTRTVKEVYDEIRAQFGSTNARKQVIAEHAVGTQTTERYPGTIEYKANDSVLNSEAVFAESYFFKFTTANNPQQYMYQDILNFEGFKQWQKQMEDTGSSDPNYHLYKSDWATYDQAKFDALTIADVRKTIPVLIDAANVLIDDTELRSLETLLGITSPTVTSASDEPYLPNDIIEAQAVLDDGDNFLGEMEVK